MKNLLKFLFEGDDRGVGFEPLLAEFVWDVYGLTDEQRKDREAKLKGYYNAIYSKSKSIHLAYGRTRDWAKKIFVAPYVKKAIDKMKDDQ